LDSRFELARDLVSIERCLISTNNVFRVVGALGAQNSGRSSSLMAVTTTTKPVNEAWFSSKSNGLDVFVHPQRRIFLVDFPSVCSPANKRPFEAPIFASQLRDLARLYDLRIAFTALVTCTALLLCVVEENDSNDPLFQLVKAASAIIRRRGWPCAQVIFVRNFVEAGQCLNTRRLQADERTIQTTLEGQSPVHVAHLPSRKENDRESTMADRRLARYALSSFASRGVRVPIPNRPLTRCTETEWLSSFIFVFNETRTHPFFVLGEEVGWLR